MGAESVKFGWRSVPVVLWAMIFTATSISGAQQPPETLEYQIKAAFLYNFAKFVEWPAGKSQNVENPVLVGVFGKDPFGSILDQTFRGKTVNGRTLEVRRISALRGLRDCHILFIGSSEKKNLGEILQAVGSESVLTVGEMERFAEQGGMVNFTTEENKIRLEINVDAAARAGIKISSKLLKLARVVRGEALAGRN